MSNAHTRGPWKVISEAAAREVEVFEVSEISHFRVVCDGPGDGFDKQGDAYADARLIAAAPELLDSARAVLAWWEEHQYDTIGDRNVYDFDPPMVVAARAAIAKATGSGA